jgi:hypothetical protein
VKFGQQAGIAEVEASGFAGDINTTRARQDALRGNAASVSKT